MKVESSVLNALSNPRETVNGLQPPFGAAWLPSQAFLKTAYCWGRLDVQKIESAFLTTFPVVVVN